MNDKLHLSSDFVNTPRLVAPQPSESRRSDPRCLRTRSLLRAALSELLEAKSFERISIAEIADTASLNRVTFYDHYVDKVALLDDLVAARFDELLRQRGVTFGSCENFLTALILAVYDYLGAAPWLASGTRVKTQSHLETAMVTVVNTKLLAGMQHESDTLTNNALIASAASWAIYGATKQWLSNGSSRNPQIDVEKIASLVSPILDKATWQHRD